MSDGKTLLVGDVGGTNARFAIARLIEGQIALEHHESFPAEQYPTFLGGVKKFGIPDVAQHLRPPCGIKRSGRKAIQRRRGRNLRDGIPPKKG